MYERPTPEQSDTESHLERRNQLTFNVAELMVVSLVNPNALLRMLDERAVTLALDPELELQRLKEEAGLSQAT